MNKQIFLEILPKKEGSGVNKDKQVINWKECIGYKVQFIYGDIKDEVEIINYLSKGQKLKIKYKDREIDMSTSHFINCKFGNILMIKTPNFKIEVGTKFNDGKRDIIIIDRKIVQTEKTDKLGRKSILNEKYYKYRCNKCRYNCGKHWNIKDNEYKDEHWVIEHQILANGSGCACCCNFPKIVVEGINDIHTTDLWMMPIINDLEFCKTHTHSCTNKIYPTCVNCRSVYKTKMTINSIYQNHGFTCLCQDGIKYPNKFAFNMLKQLYIDFETEYSPSWIGLMRYDFYIPSMNLIIEMDGEFHNKDNNMNGQTKEMSKEIDDYKDKMAEEHNIKVIRIDCAYPYIEQRFEYIKQNVINKLKNMFNLNKLEWIECNKFACSNLTKVACEYKRGNPNVTSKDIGVIMGYAPTTIITWLKIGDTLKWCEYNSDDEIDKNNKLNSERLRKRRSKITICLDTEELFESASYCSRNSLKIFGVKLTQTAIAEVCNGNRTHHKGYHFKYISNLTKEEYIKYNIEDGLKELKN